MDCKGYGKVMVMVCNVRHTFSLIESFLSMFFYVSHTQRGADNFENIRGGRGNSLNVEN